MGALSPTGPYLIDLDKGFSEDLLEEAQILLVDDSLEPVYTQNFQVKSSLASTQSEVSRGLRVADRVLSIFYELDAHDCFGQVLEWGGLQMPLQKIKEATYKVFGPAPSELVDIIVC